MRSQKNLDPRRSFFRKQKIHTVYNIHTMKYYVGHVSHGKLIFKLILLPVKGAGLTALKTKGAAAMQSPSKFDMKGPFPAMR